MLSIREFLVLSVLGLGVMSCFVSCGEIGKSSGRLSAQYEAAMQFLKDNPPLARGELGTGASLELWAGKGRVLFGFDDDSDVNLTEEPHLVVWVKVTIARGEPLRDLPEGPPPCLRGEDGQRVRASNLNREIGRKVLIAHLGHTGRGGLRRGGESMMMCCVYPLPGLGRFRIEVPDILGTGSDDWVSDWFDVESVISFGSFDESR